MVMVWFKGGQGEVRGACAPPPTTTTRNRPTWTPPPPNRPPRPPQSPLPKPPLQSPPGGPLAHFYLGAMRQRILGSHTPPCHRRMVITGGVLVWFGSRPVPDALAHGQHSPLCRHDWARRIAVVRSQGLPDC